MDNSFEDFTKPFGKYKKIQVRNVNFKIHEISVLEAMDVTSDFAGNIKSFTKEAIMSAAMSNYTLFIKLVAYSLKKKPLDIQALLHESKISLSEFVDFVMHALEQNEHYFLELIEKSGKAFDQINLTSLNSQKSSEQSGNESSEKSETKTSPSTGQLSAKS